MQTIKKLFTYTSLILIFIFLSVNSYAIGVKNCGPYYHDYKEYKTIEFSYEVVRAGNFITEVEGPFAEYYNIKKEGNIVTGLITLPPGFQEPGTHLNAITFTEQAISEGTAVAVAAIRCPIYVEYPYPGRYLLFDAHITNVNELEKANLSISVESKGDEPVIGTLMTIEIGKIDTTELVYTETFPLILPSQQIVKMIQLGTQNLKPGLYEMRSRLEYESEKIEVQRQFRVGSLDINLLNMTREVNVSPFTRIGFQLENNWNNPVKNVYVLYTIHNENITYGPQRSPGVDLRSFENQWAYSIIETPEINAGTYFISYEIHFDDNMKQGIGRLEVISHEKEFDYTILLIAIGMIVTFILILLIVVFSRTHKRQEVKKKAKK